MFKLGLILCSAVLPLLALSQDQVPVDSTDSVNIETVDTICTQRDLPDLLRKWFNKPPKNSVSAGSILLIPIIGSNPATGFMFGVGGQYGFKLKGAETKFSLISGSVQATTKKQALFLLKNSVYTKNNKIFLTGDWRYLIYSQSTYGLGTNAPEGGILDYQYGFGGQETSIDSLAQPLKFNFLRVHQSASMRILKKYKGFFVGVGYFLDYYFKIKDEKLKLNPGDSLITSHYAYNKLYGFSTEKYSASSFNLNIISDTRDNQINAYHGHFLMLSWSGSAEWLGNKKNASFLSAEWRSFHPLSKRNPRHQIAFWALGDFSHSGHYPYLILPATAYDQRSRSARGYTQGRFRGNNLVYGETEYRFPLSSCGGILGGVLFANATSASFPGQSPKLFESIKPGYGFGLRVMVDKMTRTNLAIDVGFGQKSFGFYLAASETF
ncbi:BamA/TamA family outer membrane protein [Pollutibacter soli]|uniref:BamA/TamA family outer membrane protein n=1 Tax=Pollutibacter soli TaxID=3034157 RepID=UPI003013A21F